ncbi:antitoxin MazE-like protein [Aurantimonas sp. A2-1-M11]|uniref:antitoxin MazE-like protein n=1 Tax=Aurantimonas sp. A2-1-M11 TaxID=3113712 RepID=UPI002F94B8DF
MGRPKEMTDAERAELRAKGYRQLEVWVIDRDSEAYRTEVRRELNAITEADRNDPDIDEWVVAVRGNLWDDDAS